MPGSAGTPARRETRRPVLRVRGRGGRLRRHAASFPFRRGAARVSAAGLVTPRTLPTFAKGLRRRAEALRRNPPDLRLGRPESDLPYPPRSPPQQPEPTLFPGGLGRACWGEGWWVGARFRVHTSRAPGVPPGVRAPRSPGAASAPVHVSPPSDLGARGGACTRGPARDPLRRDT